MRGSRCRYTKFLLKGCRSIIFDYDRTQAIKTRKAVLDRVATDRTLVMGYHFPFPAAGHVERFKGAYRWKPSTGHGSGTTNVGSRGWVWPAAGLMDTGSLDGLRAQAHDTVSAFTGRLN